jgi:hypothetical protein
MKLPPLSPPYDQALRLAVDFIMQRFDPLGIIAAGTILRGCPSPTSDLDLYVLHGQPWRQRLQKFFNGVPTEIFVNPAAAIVGYLAEEQNDGRPLTAHMLATGFVVLDRHPDLERLRRRARELLDNPTKPGPEQLTSMRYMAALQYEDALDISTSDRASSNMILSEAVHAMLMYAFRAAGRHIPRQKDLLDDLNSLDPGLGAMARDFYSQTDFSSRLTLASRISAQALQVQGFFEWESKPDGIRDQPS